MDSALLIIWCPRKSKELITSNSLIFDLLPTNLTPNVVLSTPFVLSCKYLHNKGFTETIKSKGVSFTHDEICFFGVGFELPKETLGFMFTEECRPAYDVQLNQLNLETKLQPLFELIFKQITPITSIAQLEDMFPRKTHSQINQIFADSLPIDSVKDEINWFYDPHSEIKTRLTLT